MNNQKEFNPRDYDNYLTMHRIKGHTTMRMQHHGRGQKGRTSAMLTYKRILAEEYETLAILRVDSITGEIWRADPDTPDQEKAPIKRVGLFDKI